MKYHTGLLIGRFQPFHLGHLYLVQKSLDLCDQLVIAIGSANVTNDSNPLSYEVRRQLLEKVIQQEKIADRITKIVPSDDFPKDEDWAADLFAKVGQFDVGIGNNDWTNGVLKAAGYPVVELELLNRDIYQGTVIRQLIKDHKPWQQLLPSYLVADVMASFKLQPNIT